MPPQEVSAGDIVLIPPRCRQRITNSGAGDLIFLAVCTPRFCNEAYEDIDNPQRRNPKAIDDYRRKTEIIRTVE